LNSSFLIDDILTLKTSPRVLQVPVLYLGLGIFILLCHSDRSGPILSFAPQSGASGRAVEESWRNPSVLPLSRFSSFAFRLPLLELPFPAR